jgi:hypothetical protein
MVRTICVSTNLHYKSFVEVGTIKIVQKQEGNQSDISYKSVLQNKKKHKETGHMKMDHSRCSLVRNCIFQWNATTL